MLFSSPIFAKASGSINGMTFSHNKGGQYVRCRNMPTNPNTCRQINARNAFTYLNGVWTELLSSTQRESWEVYAENVPVTNRIGMETNLSGQNWFIGNNMPMVSLGMDPILNGPTTFNRSNPGNLTVAQPETDSEVVVTIETPGDWEANINGMAFIYQSVPVNASRNFVPPTFTLVDTEAGDDISPPTSFNLTTSEMRYPSLVGQQWRLQIRTTPGDGRLSAPVEFCIEPTPGT